MSLNLGLMQKLSRIFLLGPLKYLNITILMDYYWEIRFYLLQTVNVRYQYWYSNLDILVYFYFSVKWDIKLDTNEIKIQLGKQVCTGLLIWSDFMGYIEVLQIIWSNQRNFL